MTDPKATTTAPTHAATTAPSVHTKKPALDLNVDGLDAVKIPVLAARAQAILDSIEEDDLAVQQIREDGEPKQKALDVLFTTMANRAGRGGHKAVKVGNVTYTIEKVRGTKNDFKLVSPADARGPRVPKTPTKPIEDL